MKLIKTIQKKLAEFCASVWQFPVETILCFFAFVLSVALVEMECRNWGEDGYFFKQFAPVSLMYVATVFSIAFSLRVGWVQPAQQKIAKVFYWLSGLLVVVPQFFFALRDFGHHYLFDEVSFVGVNLLAVILLFTARRNKDNHLFVSDGIKMASSLMVAVVLTGAIAVVYYAISASVFYLFFDDYFNNKYLVFRVIFGYAGIFYLVVLAPLLFCYSAKRIEKKEAATLTKEVNMVLRIVTLAIICYALVLFLYAAKIVFVWSLPRGGVAWMVLAYLVVAFLVYMLQPFLPKSRFSIFFKYFPIVSAVPLALFWVSVVRRIGDYGLTEDRIYLFAFGLLMTLFIAFSLTKRLNSYLLMAALTAVTVFFLTLVPPTSALSLAVANQKQRVDDFLTKYPIYNDSTKSFVPESEIPAECLGDTVGCRRFVSSLRYLYSKDASAIDLNIVPNAIKNPYSPTAPSKQYMEFVNSDNTPVAGYSYVYPCICKTENGCFKVDGKIVLKCNEDAFLKENRSVLTKACAKNEQLPGDLFCVKNDSVMVVLRSFSCVYNSEKDSVESIDFECFGGAVLSKKPIIPNCGKRGPRNNYLLKR